MLKCSVCDSELVVVAGYVDPCKQCCKQPATYEYQYITVNVTFTEA